LENLRNVYLIEALRELILEVCLEGFPMYAIRLFFIDGTAVMQRLWVIEADVAERPFNIAACSK